MKFVNKKSIFDIDNWSLGKLLSHSIIWTGLFTVFIILSGTSPLWLCLGTVFALITFFLEMWKYGVEGDVREIVISHKQVAVEKNGYIVRQSVPDKVKRQVKHNGRWFEIIEKKRKRRGQP
jgi:hypothetical protein